MYNKLTLYVLQERNQRYSFVSLFLSPVIIITYINIKNTRTSCTAASYIYIYVQTIYTWRRLNAYRRIWGKAKCCHQGHVCFFWLSSTCMKMKGRLRLVIIFKYLSVQFKQNPETFSNFKAYVDQFQTQKLIVPVSNTISNSHISPFGG